MKRIKVKTNLERLQSFIQTVKNKWDFNDPYERGYLKGLLAAKDIFEYKPPEIYKRRKNDTIEGKNSNAIDLDAVNECDCFMDSQ